MSDNIELRVNGQVVYQSGTGANPGNPSIPLPDPPVIPPHVPTIPGGDLGNVVPFSWPAQGQNKVTVNAGYGKTTLRILVPADLDLSRHNVMHTGFGALAETPGATTLNRTITVRINGAVVFGPQDVGSAPKLDFALNNPAGFRALGAIANLQPGDEVLYTVDNVGLEGTPYTTANFNFDWANANRRTG